MKTGIIKVLLIENDPDYCRDIQSALLPDGAPSGFRVDVAPTLAEALRCLDNPGRYDLLLLDLFLPDSSGLATFDALCPHCASIPVIVTGEEHDSDAALQAIRRGAADHIARGARSFSDMLVRTILHVLERRRAEDTVRQCEGNLRSVINAAIDGIVVTDRQRVILFANPPAIMLLGYGSFDELIGESFPVRIVPGQKGEIEIPRVGKRPAVVDMTVVPIIWQTKEACLVSLHDKTDHKASERKLDKYRRNLRTLVRERADETDADKELLSVTFSSMAEGVIVVDTDKRIMLFNKVAETLAGWECEPIQDRIVDHVFHLIDERTGQLAENPIDRVLRSGRTETGMGFDVLAAIDGSERPISMLAAPIQRNDRSIIGIVLLFRDVSSEREIERLKQDFLSSVSHELRTPLTSIKAYTETILHDTGMTEQTRLQFLNIIDEESNRLAELIEELLEMSRLESGVATVVREPVDIVPIVNQVAAALDALARRKDIELAVEIDSGLPPLIGDARKLESVITNLVNNAIKYTPEHGTIHVLVRRCSGQIVISVIDTGMGIPKASQDRIFERFYRATHPGKHIKGTGLGLAIVKKIVEMHGGVIDVTSNVGQGTTFAVRLPLADHPVDTRLSMAKS